ncbi:MAG: bifunctional folylpolyglutamate synthase/dihydrofolate synthase [Lachnospiraceae bacterium]|nr:bifunctional folylpolyglutamate synthase/dihydrofolate synthase [Lachnospiraceae bacterium]
MMEKQARDYLLEIPLWTKKKNTLSQVRDFLAALGNPDRDLKIIHVAGTNGKGSVCADLTGILVQAGYRVGTFVSPHLVDVKERFLLDGSPVEEAVFERSFRKVLAVVEVMVERGYCHPTFFEFVFLMAMVLYRELGPDYVILETGLGGRLDTTNVIERPLACVITSISLDHTQYLGGTIAEIAAEKAGIIKPGVPVIYDDNEPEASAVICRAAQAVGAEGIPAGEAEAYRDVAFAAPYQAMNAALAVRTLEILQASGKVEGITPQVCREGLLKVHWSGRMEEIRPDIWLDGAHNPGGIAAFIRAVQAQKSQKKIQLLFAAVADKDYHEMVNLLCRALPITRVTVVQLQSERGLDSGRLARQFEQAGCNVVEQFPSAREALHAALQNRTSEDRLYVVGSLYLIGEIQNVLKEE